MFKLKGVVKVVNPTQQVSEKFSKRIFVITDNSSMYPQDIEFQLQQDKCPLLDGIAVGQEIEVNFNLKGREWTNPQGEVKYFNTLEAWKIDKLGVFTTAPQPTQAQGVGTVDDNLPF